MKLVCLSARLRFAPFFLGLAAPLLAQSTTRVSVGSGGVQGNGFSYQHSMSANARFVAFYSEASNLAPGDTNSADDIFVRDLRSGVTKLVSLSQAGLLGDGDSERPKLSADGRTVVFFSEATNLVPNDTNDVADVFVRDLKSGALVRASVDSHGAEGLADSGTYYGPAISADGRHVAFFSLAPNLVPLDTNGTWDVFVRDLASATTTRVSVDSSGAEARQSVLTPLSPPVLSADGRFVAFESDATNLVPLDTNRRTDIFVHDRKTGVTTRVSVSSSGAQADNASRTPALSADGRFVSFESGARNLGPNTGDNVIDIFVHDRLNGTTTLASLSSSGALGNFGSGYASLSPDGRYVVFQSYATNLVPLDTNGKADVFLRDLQQNTTTRLSLSTDGAQGSHSSYEPLISADGNSIVFWTAAPEFAPGDTNDAPDVFLRRLDERLRR